GPSRSTRRVDGRGTRCGHRDGRCRAPLVRTAGKPADRGVCHRIDRGRVVDRRGAALMPVRIGGVVFPGSNRRRDTLHALAKAGAEPVALWHEQATLDGVAAVVLPGGFAYGDYLRAGVIARFSPVMRAVGAFAGDGGLVLGICN